MYYPSGGGNYKLASSIGSTDTSILLSSFTEPVSGTPYTMSYLNSDIEYMTISPKTTTSEFISFTGITQNANGSALLTGVTRGLSKSYPYTASSAYRLPHSGQTTVILSNAPQVFEKFISLENDVTITGVKTFTTPDYPQVDDAGTPPTLDAQLATKKYVDDTVVFGAPDASNTTKGITKLSIAAVSPTNPIAVGDNDTRVPSAGQAATLPGTSGTPGSTNKYATENDTSNGVTKTASTISFTASTHTIADSGNGFVTANFRPGDSVIVTGSGSNNGTYTMSTVAAGAIVVVESLVDESAGASVTLATVTINKIFRLNSSGAIPSTFLTSYGLITDVQIFTASGTWTMPTGAKVIEVVCIGSGGSGASGGRNNGADVAGGGGGGGGAVTRIVLNASVVGGTETVTVAAQTTGGTAVSGSNLAGNNGNDGSSSSFGTWLKAGGGGAGQGSGQGGGGGSVINNASGATGGTPTAATDAIAGQGVTAPSSGTAGRSAEWGGGTGGSCNNGTPGNGLAGGSSIFSAGGGGGGASNNNSNKTGAAGGTSQAYTSGGGGAHNAAGSTNTVTKKGYGGDGGGGGDGNNAGAGTTGGAGGIPGGGGGGGGSATTTSGAGGVGARGEVRVFSYF